MQQDKGHTCRALFDFTGRSEVELTFKQGDVIENVEEKQGGNGWWTGTFNGQVGAFPSNYVERMYAINIPVIAKWDYIARTDTELSLKKGDVFNVNDKDGEDKWWHGVFTVPEPRQGWFPAAFVEVLSIGPPEPALEKTTTPKVFTPPVYAGVAPTPVHSPYSNTNDNQSSSSFSSTTTTTTTTTTLSSPKKEDKKEQKKKEKEQKKKEKEEKKKKQQPEKYIPTPKPIQREKPIKGCLATLEVEVVSAKGLPETIKSACVSIGLRNDDNDKLNKIFVTEKIKKDPEPIWNESFGLNIQEPEETELVISIMDGKKVIGQDLVFHLRSTKRVEFEQYGGSDKEHNIPGIPGGTIRLGIKYLNANAMSRPKNFKKEESIQLDASTGGFDLSAASPEWIAVFKAAGLDVNDVQNDPTMREVVRGVISTHLDDGYNNNNNVAPSIPDRGPQQYYYNQSSGGDEYYNDNNNNNQEYYEENNNYQENGYDNYSYNNNNNNDQQQYYQPPQNEYNNYQQQQQQQQQQVNPLPPAGPPPRLQTQPPPPQQSRQPPPPQQSRQPSPPRQPQPPRPPIGRQPQHQNQQPQVQGRRQPPPPQGQPPRVQQNRGPPPIPHRDEGGATQRAPPAFNPQGGTPRKPPAQLPQQVNNPDQMVGALKKALEQRGNLYGFNAPH